MTTGIVTSVSPSNGGGTLSVNASVGSDVLLLDDAEPFAEDFTEPRYLVIGSESTPREYIATQNDEDDPTGEYVVLADPLDVEFEAGLLVTPWDPTVVTDDKRAITHAVWVRLDGQDGTIRATVPHELIPLSGVDTLVGASVGLLEDPMTGWALEQVFGRTASVRQEFIDTPTLAAYLDIPAATSSGVWNLLFDWVQERSHPDLSINFANEFEIRQPGVYLVIFTARFDTNASGARSLRIIQGSTIIGEVQHAASASGQTQIQVSAVVVVTDAQAVAGSANSIELWVRQTSGGAVNVLAAAPEDTRVEILRVA